MVAETFGMLDNNLDDEHAGFPLSMLILNDNASNFPFHETVLHLLISHFFLTYRVKAYHDAPY